MIDRKKIKAVGFDVDGTLYTHTTESTIAISRQVAEVASQLLGRGDEEFIEEYLDAREKYRSNTLALNSLGLDGEKIFQGVLDRFPLEKYVEKDKRLVEMVTKLTQSYRLFIITNGARVQVERKLKILGLNYADFDPFICCYDRGWVKPQPAPFLAALEELKIEAENVAYVGDRADVDVEGAKAVGMKTVLIGGESTLADASIEAVYDILNVL